MYPHTYNDNRRPVASQHRQPTYPPPTAGYAHLAGEWQTPSFHPYGPSWAHTPAAPPPVKRRGRGWALMTAGVLALAAVASAIVWWPHSIDEGASKAPTAVAPPPAPPLPVSAMDGLLLTRGEAGKIFGTRPMGGRDGRSDQVYSRMSPHRPVVDDDCNQGTPGLAKNHEGSGWQAVRQQFLITQNTSPQNARSLKQAVVNFPDADAAQQFVETSKAALQRCANRSVNLKTVANTGDRNDYWNTGEVSETGGGIRMVFTQEGQNGWTCDDSMTPHDNIVIELEMCGASPTKPVDEVLAQITDNIEAAT